jgi:large subunit ribosomal protein L7e
MATKQKAEAKPKPAAAAAKPAAEKTEPKVVEKPSAHPITKVPKIVSKPKAEKKEETAKPAKQAAPATSAPATSAAPASKAPAATASAPKAHTEAAGKTGPEPESLLKKRKTAQSQQAKRQANAVERKKRNKTLRKEAFKRAEKYVREYRSQEKALVRSKRQAKNNNNFFITPESRVLFAVRIRGINAMDPKTRKILQLLRLRQVHNGVFVKVNAASLNMLRLVEGYITYGAPNRKTVQDLIYKRGFGKVNHQRIPLSNNQVIRQELGKFGIVCIEDLIHEIFTVGPHFKEVNNFLWPFKLSSPLGGYKYKGSHFTEGGDYGNREELINNLVRQMN